MESGCYKYTQPTLTQKDCYIRNRYELFYILDLEWCKEYFGFRTQVVLYLIQHVLNQKVMKVGKVHPPSIYSILFYFELLNTCFIHQVYFLVAIYYNYLYILSLNIKIHWIEWMWTEWYKNPTPIIFALYISFDFVYVTSAT